MNLKPSQCEIVRDVACTVCGCVCDDLTLQIENNRLVSLEPKCPLAESQLLNGVPDVPATAFIQDVPVDFMQAIQATADVIRNAQSPLIYGLSRSSTAGQRAAVRLADCVGASIDTTASTCHAPSVMALQQVGESTSSLGEVKNRADLVVYWGSNPTKSHPRHVERFVDADGEFIRNGRTDRHVVVVDAHETETTQIADNVYRVRPGGDFEFIWALRSLLAGHRLTIESAGGVPIDSIREFANMLKTHRYVAVFFGLGLTRGPTPHADVEALLRLTTDLNRHTRCVVRRMRIPGDVAGADSVLCWQTGFPFSVNLSRGYPRYGPGEYSANELLRRGEVDAAIMVGSEGINKLSPAAVKRLREIPVVILDYPGVESPVAPQISFATAIYGVHRTGTAYRMDEIPIPLRQVIPSSLPADHEILESVITALQQNS